MHQRYRALCTYFDHNYLRKGLALYLSLRKSRPHAILVVLALSERCAGVLEELALPDLVVIPLEKVEEEKARLLEAKTNRKLVEYYFTNTMADKVCTKGSATGNKSYLPR